MADTNPPTSVDDILASKNLGSAADHVDKVMSDVQIQQGPNGSVFRSGGGNGVGPISTAIGDNFFGINHRQQPNPISINRDQFGLTFFTRPLLNMQSKNIRNLRQLSPLLNQKAESIQRIIRCTLDPTLAYRTGGDKLTCPFVDNQQAFIPLLTNNLLSMGGWPDLNVPIYQSAEGVYKETFGMVDGLAVNYSAYDITATFRNLPGDPITALFYNWAWYMAAVYEGTLVPYPEMIIENEIDYQTRIYRLVLDYSRTKVQKIAACGAAIPTTAPIGAAFNFESDRPLNNAADQISMDFRCFGAMYQDDILIEEFNNTVIMFNDSMADKSRKGILTKVPMAYLEIFNHRGYPRINPQTYELEWWVETADYNLAAPKLSGSTSTIAGAA